MCLSELIKTKINSQNRDAVINRSPSLFSDTICDLGGVDELANYGEYSGAPSEQQTYDYAKTILSLMTREKHTQGGYSRHFVSGLFAQTS